MKKIIAGLLILIVCYIAFVLLKPVGSKEISVQVNCTEGALMRNLLNINNWQNWWPGKKINDTTFNFNKVDYTVKNILANGIVLQVKSLEKTETAYLQFVPINDTGCYIKWNNAQPKKPKIADKLLHPFSTNHLENNNTILLDSLKVFFNNPVNIYGFKAIITKVTDPHLISVKSQYENYPTTADIYSDIKILQAFALLNGAKQTNPPMINIHTSESGKGLDAMVAIPVNIALQPKGNILPKFMIQGALLTAQITGDEMKVQKALSEFENYLIDYKLSAPAIPYQSLVTDRMLVTDSTKWITNIYQPIFKKIN